MITFEYKCVNERRVTARSTLYKRGRRTWVTFFTGTKQRRKLHVGGEEGGDFEEQQVF